MDFPTFLKEVRRGEFRSAYLFTGKEDFLAEIGVQELTARLLTADERELNLAVFYGRNAEALPEALATPPIFASRRVVLVRQAGELADRYLDAALAFLKNPPADGCLILLGGEDRRRAFSKRFEGLLEPIACAKLKPSALHEWVVERVAKFGKKLDSEAAARFLAVGWPGMRELATEIDRLTLLVGDKTLITAQDVEESGGGSFEFARWRLTDAVADGNLAGALTVVENLMAWSVKPTQIVGDLYRLLWQLWFLRWHIEQGKGDQARKHIGAPDFVFQRLLRQAARFPTAVLEDGILHILEADLSIKRGLRPDFLESSILVADLVGILNARAKASEGR